MPKTLLPIAWFVILAVAIPACSSSQRVTVPEATSPDSTNRVSSDSQVNSILEKSCYECHSTGGSVPWYAAVSPTYLAANSARGVLNFSDWQTYDAQKKSEALKNIENSVNGGLMPPGDYTALDHSARLTDDEKQALLRRRFSDDLIFQSNRFRRPFASGRCSSIPAESCPRRGSFCSPTTRSRISRCRISNAIDKIGGRPRGAIGRQWPT
jgi:hypothetical protein